MAPCEVPGRCLRPPSVSVSAWTRGLGEEKRRQQCALSSPAERNGDGIVIQERQWAEDPVPHHPYTFRGLPTSYRLTRVRVLGAIIDAPL